MSHTVWSDQYDDAESNSPSRPRMGVHIGGGLLTFVVILVHIWAAPPNNQLEAISCVDSCVSTPRIIKGFME